MDLEVTSLLSLAAVLISLVGLTLNARKGTRTEAAATARMEAKLDGVANGIDEIRVEIRSMRETVIDHGQRLARLEAVSSNHGQRLDAIEKQHPPD